METLDIQTIISRIDQLVLAPAKKILDTLPPEYVPLILGTAAAVAFIVTLLVIVLSRPSKKGAVTPISIPGQLRKEGAIIDIALPGSPTSICGRAVVTAAKRDRIRLEMIENAGSVIIKQGAEILLMFRPQKTQAGKINSFVTQVINTENRDGLCSRLCVEAPESYQNTPRRQHRRKRVVDQQFIRVKVWLGSPETLPSEFSDAVPDLAVNSYDPRADGHENNSVINISKGGIGVSASPELVNNKFTLDCDVVVNIFMFNFRQKIFKPYWYAGKVRAIEDHDSSNFRIGVEFTRSGAMQDEDEQIIEWIDL